MFVSFELANRDPSISHHLL